MDDHITFHNGEQAVELAVCVGENRLGLYYDSESQTLFAEFEPPGINDGCYHADCHSETGCNARGLTPADLTKDGCDDLWLRFTSGDGTARDYIYAWNSVHGEFEIFDYTALSGIDPYVIKADVKVYLSEEEIILFKALLDGIFSQAERVELSDDYDANLRVMTAIKYSPYCFFVESDTFTDDHGAIMLTYAYEMAEQEEMRAFMDAEMLNIINSIIRYPDMNELEKILAVYQYFAEHIIYDYEWLDGFGNCGLRYFGMTDAERAASGVTIDYTAIDDTYGSVVCDDRRFESFREVYDFVLEPEHQISLYMDMGINDLESEPHMPFG